MTLTARFERDDVVEKLRPEAVLRHFGTKGRRCGREFRTRTCPACGERTRADAVAVNVETGMWRDHMRLDEVLHLAWDDVDLSARLLTVQRGRQGTVKSGRIRQVPILDSVLPVLQARALKRGGAMFAFPGKTLGKARRREPVQVAFKHALRRAGLDKLRWHDLRHTCASWWVLSGGDIFRLSKMLGHANVSITQKTYAHLAPEAWQQDYHRLAFHCPGEPAKVYEFKRDAAGKLAGRRVPGSGASGSVARTA